MIGIKMRSLFRIFWPLCLGTFCMSHVNYLMIYHMLLPNKTIWSVLLMLGLVTSTNLRFPSKRIIGVIWNKETMSNDVMEQWIIWHILWCQIVGSTYKIQKTDIAIAIAIAMGHHMTDVRLFSDIIWHHIANLWSFYQMWKWSENGHFYRTSNVKWSIFWWHHLTLHCLSHLLFLHLEMACK